jgi:hypothetical protein
VGELTAVSCATLVGELTAGELTAGELTAGELTAGDTTSVSEPEGTEMVCVATELVEAARGSDIVWDTRLVGVVGTDIV